MLAFGLWFAFAWTRAEASSQHGFNWRTSITYYSWPFSQLFKFNHYWTFRPRPITTPNAANIAETGGTIFYNCHQNRTDMAISTIIRSINFENYNRTSTKWRCSCFSQFLSVHHQKIRSRLSRGRTGCGLLFAFAVCQFIWLGFAIVGFVFFFRFDLADIDLNLFVLANRVWDCPGRFSRSSNISRNRGRRRPWWCAAHYITINIHWWLKWFIMLGIIISHAFRWRWMLPTILSNNIGYRLIAISVL